MFTLFDDLAVLHDEDEVGVADRGKTVGDGEARLAVHQVVDGVLYQLLRTRVDRGGRFIQNEKRFSGYESTGNGQ